MSEKQERILIVDDEEKARRIIHVTLSRKGYHCQEADSAEQALGERRSSPERAGRENNQEPA